MREKEQVVADFAKLSKGEMLIGVVQEVTRGGTYNKGIVVIRGAMIGRKGGKWTASEEIRIGENTSLSRSRLGEEVGSLVVIGCWSVMKATQGMSRMYKVLLPENLAEVEALTGPEPIPSEILSLWALDTPGRPTTDSAGGDDDLPF